AVMTLTRLALGSAAATPFSVKGPDEVEVVQGYSTVVPVTISRAKEQMALAVQGTGTIPQVPPPPGAAVPPVRLTFKPSAAAVSAQANFTVTAAITAPEGLIDFVVEGKAKINNADRTVLGPAVAVKVVRPFTVELLTPSLALVPGQTVALKGRLQR